MMKKYIQPEISVLEMQLDSQLCQASGIDIVTDPSDGPALAPEIPGDADLSFDIWDAGTGTDDDSES